MVFQLSPDSHTRTLGSSGKITNQEFQVQVSTLSWLSPAKQPCAQGSDQLCLDTSQDQHDKWESFLSPRPQAEGLVQTLLTEDTTLPPPGSRDRGGGGGGRSSPTRDLVEPPWVPVPPHSALSNLVQHVSFD